MWVRKGLLQAVGFEPDVNECRRLIARNRGTRYYPWALGDRTEKRILHVTEFPECSSIYEPDMSVLKAYPVWRWFEVREVPEVQVYRFDDLQEQQKVDFVPDFVHIDVQGFECQVLEGMGKYLDSVSCIEIESHLKPIYKGQKVFPEVKYYLEHRGFMLRDIETQGVFEGEVVELNAFFVRSDTRIGERQSSLIRIWERIQELKTRLLFRDCQWMHEVTT
jgi:FkbM family methyltransferase